MEFYFLISWKKMSYSFIQFSTENLFENSMLLLIELFLYVITSIIFYLLSKEQIHYIIEKEKTDKESFLDRYENLTPDQIDFYFELGQKNLDNIFKLRNDENKTILSHVAIIAAAFSLFYFLGTQTFKYQDDLTYFLPLFVFLLMALFNMLGSITSMFQSLSLPYSMPSQLHEIDVQYTNLPVVDLKKMQIERFASDAKRNSKSNIRKMRLLNYSRFFLRNAFIFLGIAFLFICAKKYISFFLV